MTVRKKLAEATLRRIATALQRTRRISRVDAMLFARRLPTEKRARLLGLDIRGRSRRAGGVQRELATNRPELEPFRKP